MNKRLFSLLLCAALLIGLFPGFAYAKPAENHIPMVEVTAPNPDYEEEIPCGSTHAKRPTVSTAHVYLASYEWKDLTENRLTEPGEIFEAEHAYRLTVRVVVTDSTYCFDDLFTVFKINDYYTLPIEHGEDYAVFYRDFKLNSPSIIYTVRAETIEPVKGEEIPFGAFHANRPVITEGSVDLIGYEWWDMTEGRKTTSGELFRVEHEYRLVVQVTRSDKGHILVPFSYTACLINDHLASYAADGENNKNVATFYLDFTKIFGPNKISRVDATSVIPQVGEEIPYGIGHENAPMIPTERTKLVTYEWKDLTTNLNTKYGDTFLEGHRYRLTVQVQKFTLEDYNFADDARGFINGLPAVKGGANSETVFTFYYDFPIIIGSVAVSGVVEPATDASPAYDLEIEDPLLYFFDTSTDYTYGGSWQMTHSGVTWYRRSLGETEFSKISSGIPFEPVNWYKVTVRLKPAEGYGFDKNTTATINGLLAVIENVAADGSWIEASYSYLLGEWMGFASFTVPEPEAGQRIEYDAVPESDEYYRLNTDSYLASYFEGVAWYDETEGEWIKTGKFNYFVQDHVYTVFVRVEALGDRRFVYRDGVYEVTARVNDDPNCSIEMSIFGTFNVTPPGKDIIISHTFDPCPCAQIRGIDVTLADPLPGLPISHEPAVEEEALYSLVTDEVEYPGGVRWTVYDAELDTWNAVSPETAAVRSGIYTAYVLLEVKDPAAWAFAFNTSQIAVDIGGEAGEVEELLGGGQRIVVRRTYDAGDTLYVPGVSFSFPVEGVEPYNEVEAMFTFNPYLPTYRIADYNEYPFHGGVAWSDDTAGGRLNPGDVFIGGHLYTCYIIVEPEDGNAFTMPLQHMLIGGESAELCNKEFGFDLTYVDNSPSRAVIKRSFNLPLIWLDDFDLYIDEPQDAERIRWPDITDFPGFGIIDAVWTDEQTGEEMSGFDTFEEGRQYTVTFTLRVKNGYAFLLNGEFEPVFMARVNGNAADNGKVPGENPLETATVSYTFTATAEMIETVDVDLAPPLAGEHPSFSPDHREYYSPVDVVWTDSLTGDVLSEEDIFILGREYEAAIILDANPGCRFKTVTDGEALVPDVTAVFSGKAPSAILTGPSGDATRQIEIRAAFTCTDEIRYFEAATTGYAPGNTPADVTFSFPDGAGYELDKAVWYDQKTNTALGGSDTFADGEPYTLEIHLRRSGAPLFEASYDADKALWKPSWFIEGTADGLPCAIDSSEGRDARDYVLLTFYAPPCGKTLVDSIEISGFKTIEVGMTLQEYRDSLVLTVPKDAPYVLGDVACGSMGPDDRFQAASNQETVYVPVILKDGYAFWSLYDSYLMKYSTIYYATALVDGEERYWTPHGDGRYTLLVSATVAQVITATFDPNGGEGSMPAVHVGVLDDFVLPACGFTAPYGKEFSCWRIGGMDCAPGDTVEASIDLIDAGFIITAVWQDKAHMVTRTLTDQDSREVVITVTTNTGDVHTAGNVSAAEPVLVAAYDADGRFLGVAWVSAPGDTKAADASADSLTLFWVDGDFRPKAEAEKVLME